MMNGLRSVTSDHRDRADEAVRAAPRPETDSRPLITSRFRRIRTMSSQLAARLTPEDQMVQAGPDCSPTKWHLAHTSWFLERFVLERFATGYTAFDDRFTYLFNALTEPADTCHPASQRALLSRPSADEVQLYRDHVNAAVLRLIADVPSAQWPAVARRLDLALLHEQKHQELILTDIKQAFWMNPLRPAYHGTGPGAVPAAPGQGWFQHGGGLVEIGQDTPAPEAETPRHPVFVAPFRFAGRLVTGGEYLEFMEDRGYTRRELWHPDGWTLAQREGWNAPLYWFKRGGVWHQFTLGGTRLLDVEEPVCHVSWYEADAFARWDGRRLPTEAEWEIVAAERMPTGNLLDHGRYHPAVAAARDTGPWQLFGDTWEWTRSAFAPYPRHQPGDMAIGEYADVAIGGRFTLRGGSALTPADMVRATTRHALAPHVRLHMTGIRLVEDV